MTELVITDRPDRTLAARERANRTMFGLHQLLSTRPDLRGVHAPADFTADAIRWSV